MVCERCGRETYESVYARLYPCDFSALVDAKSCSASSGFDSDVEDCARHAEIRAAYVRGMLDGVEVAKERAHACLDEDEFTVARDRWIDWTEVDAEIERRTR